MSASRIKGNFLRTVRILRVTKESPLVKTYFFMDRLCAHGKPGQFVMIWLPGSDEIPMSISSAQPSGLASITVAKVGEATTVLQDKAEGDVIGIRGPFGNSFKPVKGKILLVGGGTGLAPLVFLAEKLVESNTEIIFALGARTKVELIFLSRIRKMLSKTKGEIRASTEDGSYGCGGVVTELAEKALVQEKFDAIFACGREAMLFKIFMLAKKHRTPLQACLERVMRCAIGLCGSCTIGKYRVCIDGPVFTETQLREAQEEFGSFKRDFDGRKIPV